MAMVAEANWPGSKNGLFGKERLNSCFPIYFFLVYFTPFVCIAIKKDNIGSLIRFDKNRIS